MSSSEPKQEEEKHYEQEEELMEDDRSPSSSQSNPYPPNNDLVSNDSLLLFYIFKDIFIEVSPSTKISLILLTIGSFIIFISLPNQIILGIIFLLIGFCGLISILTTKYISFAQQHGLISLMKPSIIKQFILNGSIVDIFYEIRNSKLGIPDFLLSQILPLDDPERDMIFERLPEITREFVSKEGLIYLTPQAIQNIVLPMHLRGNNNNNNSIEYEDLSELPALDIPNRLSPITGSPHSSQSNNNSDENNNSEEKSLRNGLLQQNKNEIMLQQTKNEIQTIGKKWLNIAGTNTNNTAISVITTSSDTSSNSTESEEDKKDIVDSDLNDEIPIESNIKTDVSMENENENNNNKISWIGQVGKILSGNDTLATKPIIKAVIDTRMKELALQIISYVWKSPFAQISDGQLIVIFICCIGIVSFYLTKNKQIRIKFIKSMKYMGVMVLFWIAILCFIELNVRRKSKLFNNIYNYINKKLFHSEHHKAVRKRKERHNLMKQSKSMTRHNLFEQSKFRRLKYKDKKSKFSKTMPFINKINNNRNISGIDSPNSNASNYSSMSTDSHSLSPYSMLSKNKNKRTNLFVSSDNVLQRRVTNKFNYK